MSGGSLRSSEMKRSNSRLVVDGVDLGDAEAVAQHRIGGRAAALAQDALLAGEAHDVVHGEEIGRVVELLDEREFVGELLRDTSSGTPSG